MNRLTLLPCVVAMMLLAASASAQIEATTSDGKTVILNKDFTWRYAEPAAEGEAETEVAAEPQPPIEGTVTLAIERRFGNASSCTFGIRAFNELPYMVESLVPRFSAYSPGDLLIDTVFKSLTRIKPTQSRYVEVRFERLSCEKIIKLKVHGADRCKMGSMDMFTSVPGRCLAHIKLRPSDLLEFTK